MSRSYNNLFSCFKPVMADDLPSFNPRLSSEDKNSGRRRMAVNRTFSRAVKAVFFKTSLVKKIRTRKSRQDNHRSSSKCEKRINNMKKNSSFTDEIFRTNSNHSSLFTSSSPSSASSISSNSRSGSERIKESNSLDDLKQMNRKTRTQKGDSSSRYSYEYTNGMYIIFVCLVAVVFLGKVFAILACTSTWLFFAPCNRRSEGVDLPGNSVFYSEDHKKRVIMKGLLERNKRHRLICY